MRRYQYEQERPQCLSVGDKYTLERRRNEVQNMSARYHNPYEYGSRQNSLNTFRDFEFLAPQDTTRSSLEEMGMSEVSYCEKFPGAIRNVNVESSLLQRELTHGPGQRNISEINRFELLPFDPQDTRHIIWKDNMPRGGYSSRADRLETI